MFRPLERRAFERLGLFCHLFHLLQTAIAVKHDIAAGEQGRFCSHRKRANQRAHRDVVGHQQAFEADFAPNHVANHLGTCGCRPLRVDRFIDYMRRHRHWTLIEAAKRYEIGCAQLFGLNGDAGQRQVGIRRGPPVAGYVLHHRQHATLDQPFDNRAPERHDRRWVASIGAVADNVVRTCDRHIQHRHAIDIDAQFGQVVGDQSGIKVCRLAGCILRRSINISEARRSGTFAPLRRFEARHTASFLIDQNWRSCVVHRLAKSSHQRANLLAVRNIAPEQDESPRPRVAEERTFLRSKRAA